MQMRKGPIEASAAAPPEYEKEKRETDPTAPQHVKKGRISLEMGTKAPILTKGDIFT